MKLTIGSNSPIEVDKGKVIVDGMVVNLYETSDFGGMTLVHAYCMKQGDHVRRLSKEEYVVEF